MTLLAIFNLRPELEAGIRELQEQFPDLDFEAFTVGGAVQVAAKDRDGSSEVLAGNLEELREKLRPRGP